MQQQLTGTANATAARLNPLALALAFGVAGVVEILLFGTVMGATWGMMSGAGGGGMMGGWMHGSPGSGSEYGGGPMTGGSFGYFVYALFWGFLGGVVAGGVSAWIYNNVVARRA